MVDVCVGDDKICYVFRTLFQNGTNLFCVMKKLQNDLFSSNFWCSNHLFQRTRIDECNVVMIIKITKNKLRHSFANSHGDEVWFWGQMKTV